MSEAPPGDVYDVFVSYAREDRACAERLAEALAACGLRVWWDRDIDVGADFAALIETRLQSCRSVIVLWSEHSVRSAFVKDEATRALDASKLHPVRIADVPLPLGFGQIQTADLLDCNSSGNEFRSLVAQLSRALPKSALKDQQPHRGGNITRLLTSRTSVWIVAALTIAILAAILGRSWLTERRCNDSFVRVNDGVDKLQEGNSEQAIDFFTDAIRMCRSNALAYRYRGQAYARLNDYPLAIADLQVALRLGLEGHAARRVSELLAQIDAAQKGGALPVTTAAPGDTAVPHGPQAVARGTPVSEPATSGGSRAAHPGDAGGRSTATAIGRVGTSTRPPVASAPPAGPSSQPDAATRDAVSNMFATDADTRIGATTSLLVDAKHVSAAVPLAIRTANEQPRNASGVINTLVLLQSAGPLGLQQHRAEIEQLFARVEGNGPQTADLVARVRAAMRPVVFIQIAADAQRALAERLKTTLASNGFDVPGIENVGGKSDVPAAAPQVRLQGRSGRAAAQQIAETVHELTGLTPLIQTISKASPKVDTYEVWLDRGTCINQAHRPAACAG